MPRLPTSPWKRAAPPASPSRLRRRLTVLRSRLREAALPSALAPTARIWLSHTLRCSSAERPLMSLASPRAPESPMQLCERLSSVSTLLPRRNLTRTRHFLSPMRERVMDRLVRLMAESRIPRASRLQSPVVIPKRAHRKFMPQFFMPYVTDSRLRFPSFLITSARSRWSESATASTAASSPSPPSSSSPSPPAGSAAGGSGVALAGSSSCCTSSDSTKGAAIVSIAASPLGPSHSSSSRSGSKPSTICCSVRSKENRFHPQRIGTRRAVPTPPLRAHTAPNTPRPR